MPVQSEPLKKEGEDGFERHPRSPSIHTWLPEDMLKLRVTVIVVHVPQAKKTASARLDVSRELGPESAMVGMDVHPIPLGDHSRPARSFLYGCSAEPQGGDRRGVWAAVCPRGPLDALLCQRRACRPRCVGPSSKLHLSSSLTATSHDTNVLTRLGSLSCPQASCRCASPPVKMRWSLRAAVGWTRGLTWHARSCWKRALAWRRSTRMGHGRMGGMWRVGMASRRSGILCWWWGVRAGRRGRGRRNGRASPVASTQCPSGPSTARHASAASAGWTTTAYVRTSHVHGHYTLNEFSYTHWGLSGQATASHSPQCPGAFSTGTNNCVGGGNHVSFLLFLLSQSFHLSSALLVLVSICLPSGTAPGHLTSNFPLPSPRPTHSQPKNTPPPFP